jgi:hypothetical protein
MEKPFLNNYGGQTAAELIALEADYRIDSLVLAVEQAIQNKPGAELSRSERFVLAIEAMEREVNNGGWDQFFWNTENEYNDILIEALDAIGCPETAAIAQEALDTFLRSGDFEMSDSILLSARTDW